MGEERVQKRKSCLCILFSFFVIIYATLLNRNPTLNRIAQLKPLWSYIKWLKGGTGIQILQNVFLFIPLGYFLCTCLCRAGVITVSFITSLSVELIQYISYRGMLDIDDVISNVLGAAFGVFLFVINSERLIKRITSAALICSGVVACIIISKPQEMTEIGARITSQFNFKVGTVVTVGNRLEINGYCLTYDRSTPSYTLLIDNRPISTTIQGDTFSAKVERIEKKSELQIQFSGYQPMPTGYWLNQKGGIDYIAEDLTKPRGVPDSAILKAYSPDYDTFVFQDGQKILWLIGWSDLGPDTEIIYHLHTNEPEKLPGKRIQYKFDNRGFRDGTVKEKPQIGKYRVFEDIIPDYYNVTAIVVGFNTEGTIIWSDSFRP